jgi:ribonuclease J
MNITVHRGSDQIGGSCIELAAGSTRIILDAGQILPSLDGEKGGQQPELPKVSGLYKGEPCSINAVFFTHYHGDHVGLIDYINEAVPVYISAKAVEILNKIACFTGKAELTRPTMGLKSGTPIRVGYFEVIPFLVDHSAFESYAFVIRAEGKTVVYSGDFRAHGRKAKATQYFMSRLPKQVDALLLEGTMMSRSSETVETEEEIERRAAEFMRSKKGPVLVLQSATNIDRLVGMYRAAKRSGRFFVMDIFTAHIVSLLEGSIPRPGVFDDVRVFYPRFLTKRMFEECGEDAMMKEFSRYHISREELSNRKDCCILIRDSMFSDLVSMGDLVDAGLIMSIWGGYFKTEKTKRLMAYLQEKGAEMIHLHTSGHADISFLQEFADSCSPRMIIPVHTEQPSLFKEKFSNVVTLNDGENIIVD